MYRDESCDVTCQNEAFVNGNKMLSFDIIEENVNRSMIFIFVRHTNPEMC